LLSFFAKELIKMMRKIYFISLVLTVVLVVSCAATQTGSVHQPAESAILPDTKSNARQSFNKGLNLAVRGKFNKAQTEFEKALNIDPSFEIASESLRTVESVTENKIDIQAGIHFFRGVDHANKGELDQAIARYSEAINSSPKFAAAYRTRGFAYLQNGEYDRAIADCKKAKKLNPDIDINQRFVITYLYRVVFYIYRGQYDRAIADCNVVIELNPNVAEAYIHRGLAYSKKSLYDRAISDFNKARDCLFRKEALRSCYL
jgi:tetratricopeptide (TPR) repeat protein